MSILKRTVENLAARLAATRGGRVMANHLMPYLPVSLDLIERILDALVDETVLTSRREDDWQIYEFPELLDAPIAPTPRNVCVACGTPDRLADKSPLCDACARALEAELTEMAKHEDWPAEAVWEHELLCAASRQSGPLRVASLAGFTRLSLSQLKERLKNLAARGHARCVVNFESKSAYYEFPPLIYPRDIWLRHDRFICGHPASRKCEFEIKIMKVFVVLIVATFLLFLDFLQPIPCVFLILPPAVILALWWIFHGPPPLSPLERMALKEEGESSDGDKPEGDREEDL
ncbi:MAG TPA: hypothetical protein PKH31_14490 [Candidatus Sumerlaeota bacterium]|nr:hypothetical protein [Candidatus Sumerlaeota bacterium]